MNRQNWFFGGGALEWQHRYAALLTFVEQMSREGPLDRSYYADAIVEQANLITRSGISFVERPGSVPDIESQDALDKVLKHATFVLFERLQADSPHMAREFLRKFNQGVSLWR